MTPAVEAAAPVVAPPVADTFVPLALTDITVPEGLTLDETASASFLEIMNNRDMTPQARAQSLIELQANLSRASSEAGSRQWEEQQQTWQAEVSADPEIGGANLPATLANIGRVMDKFGNDEVRAAFDQTGAGNNPAVVKFLNALGKQFAEAPLQPPGGPTNTQTLSHAERMFGQRTN